MFLHNTDLWTQIFGYAALILSISSYQFKNGKTMIGIQIIATLCWLTHFFLLNAYVGALMGCIGLFRNCSAYVVQEEHLIKIAIISSFLALSLGIYTAESWIYLTACGGSIANSLSIIFREKPFLFRIMQLVGEGLWLLYSAIVMSLPGTILGILLIASNTIGALRHEKSVIKNLINPRPKNQHSPD